MRIDKIVDAPREFIFEKIIDSCLFDIEKNTGKRPKVRSLNGYEYSKSFGKNQRGSIKITELTEPSIYAFTTKTNRNTFSTRWELHKIDDRSTQVVIKKRQMVAVLDNVNRAYNGGRAR